MNALSLQQWVIAFRWNYNGNLIKKQISKQEAARDNFNGAIIRIGREQPSCNLYLEDSSVSGQHAEIYFNEQQQKFFIKSLSPKNTTKVDGQDLVYGEELPLKNNSTIVLGRQQIEVTNIQVFELESTDYSGIVKSSSNSSPVVNSHPNSSLDNSSLNLTKSKHWWHDPTVKVAIIGAIVTLFGSLITWNANTMSRDTEIKKQDKQLISDHRKQNNEFQFKRQELYLQQVKDHRKDVRERKREMKGKYNQLMLVNNNCPDTVRVATSFTALDDVSKTRGWFLFEKEIPATVGVATTYNSVFLHAKTKINQKDVKWEPTKTGRIKRSVSQDDFQYIEEPFLDPNIDKNNPVEFYQVKFKSNSSKVTKKAFNCSDGTLNLVDAD